MSPGKQATKPEAAVVAAGVRLEKMNRRVRLSRLALFTAIAAGPVALGVAVVSDPTTVAATAQAEPTTMRTTAAAAAADPSGYAQLFLGAWLRSSANDTATAQARLAQSLAPDVELPDPAADAHDAHARLESVTAVRSAQHKPGRWWVTVAAQYADASVRYFAVPVAAGDGGGSFTVTGAPGVVASPARAEVTPSPYGVTVPKGELSSTVGEFLGAYLAGAGEVERYLAPGVHLPAVSPAPYSAVTLRRVLAVEEAAAGEKVPGDGTTVRVLAQVEARDEAGRWPLAYELEFTARSGRWDVAALASGIAQKEDRS
ncbi:conjugal transfer protein [Streptomyces sp. Tu 3180]|uniref:conjugal transfer protein n=1 Tax=Streptomyces sp. Tu 3180 TaxID=2682611 RepID=UPI001358B437|nr:conjugal transfer protein [Streptomyces sp. Tu 3180]KAF3470094.1 conjugal transfer protein [Streptomyces sp. Tu 3180]